MLVCVCRHDRRLFCGDERFARPSGGLFSDAYGRRKMLVICLLGQTIGYAAMSQMGSEWSIVMAIATVLATSVFVQGRVWGGVFCCAVNSTPYDRSNYRHGRCLWQRRTV